MKYTIMNKNTPVLLAELNAENTFTQIYEYYHLEYSPLLLANAYNKRALNPLHVLNEWFHGRGIPSWRKNLEKLLESLNIKSPTALLNKAYGLSLSDQYWLKPEQENLTWDQINFFHHDFEYASFLEISLTNHSSHKKINLQSPNNTTDGMIEKAWIIEDNQRILVKSTYTPSRQKPMNEWLATQICQRLNLSHCPYEVSLLDNKIVSKCPNFLMTMKK